MGCPVSLLFTQGYQKETDCKQVTHWDRQCVRLDEETGSHFDSYSDEGQRESGTIQNLFAATVHFLPDTLVYLIK